MRIPIRSNFSRPFIVVLAVASAGLSAGCGTSAAQGSSPPGRAIAESSLLTSTGQTRYPVTVRDCTGSHTYDRAPSRIISLDDQSTDILVAMGLAGKIVGVTKFEKPDQEWPADAGVVAKLATLPGGIGYPSLETLIAKRPDFITSVYVSAFAQGMGPATPQRWTSFGVPTYRDGCGPYSAAPQDNFNQLYFDIHNLGVIFNVQADAARLIKHLQAQVAADQALAKTAGLGNYQIGTAYGYLTTPGDQAAGTSNAVITQAGSTNVFAVDAANPNLAISREQFVKIDPQVLTVITDEGLSAAQEEHSLQSDPQLRTVRAIRTQAYVPISYYDFYGGLRLVDNGLRLLVEGLVTLKREGRI